MMTKYAVVVAFETDTVGRALDVREQIEQCAQAADWPSNTQFQNVTLHRDMRPESGHPYGAWEVVAHHTGE